MAIECHEYRADLPDVPRDLLEKFERYLKLTSVLSSSCRLLYGDFLAHDVETTTIVVGGLHGDRITLQVFLGTMVFTRCTVEPMPGVKIWDIFRRFQNAGPIVFKANGKDGTERSRQPTAPPQRTPANTASREPKRLVVIRSLAQEPVALRIRSVAVDPPEPAKLVARKKPRRRPSFPKPASPVNPDPSRAAPVVPAAEPIVALVTSAARESPPLPSTIGVPTDETLFFECVSDRLRQYCRDRSTQALPRNVVRAILAEALRAVGHRDEMPDIVSALRVVMRAPHRMLAPRYNGGDPVRSEWFVLASTPR